MRNRDASLKVAIFNLQKSNSRLLKRIKELEEQTSTDCLTGLNNRRNMEKIITREISRARRNGGKLSILLLDFDHFKCVNDRYGHLVGDSALQELAKLILREIRNIDIAFRYGGEEFLIVFPDTNAIEAKTIAERLRKSTEKHAFAGAGENFNCTISGGIAEIILPDESQKSLIDRADKALYQSKQYGRNMIAIAIGRLACI